MLSSQIVESNGEVSLQPVKQPESYFADLKQERSALAEIILEFSGVTKASTVQSNACSGREVPEEPDKLSVLTGALKPYHAQNVLIHVSESASVTLLTACSKTEVNRN